MRKKHIKICPICGAEHTKSKAKCCCIEHSKLLAQRLSKARAKPKEEKVCPRCGKHHTKDGVFCSRSCANARERTSDVKKRTSDSLKAYHKSLNPNYIPRSEQVHVCHYCGKSFTRYSTNADVKYCSPECLSKGTYQHKLDALKKGVAVLKARGNFGGYREGTGRSKSGYYKGVYCGSTYELVWLIYQIDHGKNFKRFEGVLEWNGVKYIPDFLQDGKIIELKGYWQKKVDQKCEVARHFGYDIEVLYRKDLDKEFDWVKQHYTYHDLEELYDDYKPKYEYVCAFCGTAFTRNIKSRAKHQCCSPQCAAKFNRQFIKKLQHGSVEQSANSSHSQCGNPGA